MRVIARAALAGALLWAGGAAGRDAFAGEAARAAGPAKVERALAGGAIAESANAESPIVESSHGRDAIAGFESYLERYPDSPSRAEVLYTLGQLYEEAETAAAMDATRLAAEASDTIAHPDAIRCYSAVADSYPEFAERPACLYRLAIVQMEAGEHEKAGQRLRTLLAESADGKFAGPARLRQAEMAERRAAWADAARLYGDAAASGVDSRQEKLHYRRAWALYRSGDGPGAIAVLREGIAIEERAGSDPDAGFFRESLTLLAGLQAGVTGAAGWEGLAAGIGGTAARRRFLAELGTLLEEADRAALALPVLDRAVAEGPDHPEAPLAARAAIRAADRVSLADDAPPGEDAILRRLRFEESYARGSAWRNRVSLPPEEVDRLNALCEEGLFEAGTLLYEVARRDTAGAAAAERAEATLRAALSRYPESAARDDANFLIGELARGSKRWDDAVARYDAVNADALGKAHLEPLLYGRVLAHEGARAAAVAAHGEESEAARRAALAAGGAIDAYLARFPQSPSEGTLRSKRAELLALAGDPAAAAEAFRVQFARTPAGSKGSRDLAGFVGVNLARSGRYDEAAAWYDTAKDAERAAAALYEGAHREAAAGRPGPAGLALLALRSRYPRAEVLKAATLDAIDFLSRAEATDTLAAWAATLPAPADLAGAAGAAGSAGDASAAGAAAGTASASGAAGDNLQRALVAAARRAETRDPAGAGRLYREAARFGRSEGANAALVSAGEALCAAGRREDAVAALSAAIVRFPRDAASLPPILFAADLLADSLGDAAGAATLLEKAALAARAATPGRRAAWRRRAAHALARSGRGPEASAAFDRCLADTTLIATTETKSGEPSAREPAARAPDAGASSDSILFEHETALAAIEKANILRAALPAAVAKKTTSAEAKRLQSKTDEAVGLYAFVIGRGFRDLTSRAGHDAAVALEGTARALLEAGIAGRDPALCESARRSAGRAVGFRATVAALPIAPPDEWMRSAVEGLDLRSRLATRLISAADSMAPPAVAVGLDEKTISSRIVALDRLAELLAPARGLALDDSAADLEARVALARGGYVERMAELLAAAPVPPNLGPDGEAAYRNAVLAKVDEFKKRAASVYREALDHAPSSGARSGAALQLEQRLALLAASTPESGDQTRRP